MWVLKIKFCDLRACLEAAFDSEKRQFFGETRRLFEERTQRYGQKKQRSITEKVAFAAQRVASKQALSAATNHYLKLTLLIHPKIYRYPESTDLKFPNVSLINAIVL
ncbi:MAG: hypothetical protein H6564_13325 [Lewinellaceae bacterium]|nr:hypothetical protein [Lewinellaceae bacterium]